MSNFTKRAVISTVYLSVFGILTSAFAYLTRVYLASSLSPADYGLIYSIFAFFGLFSLFQHLGLDQAMIKFVSGFLVKKELSKVKEVLLQVVMYQMISALLLGVVTFLFSSFLGVHYFGNPELSVPLFRLYIISIILSPLGLLVDSVFRAYQRMDLYSIARFVQFLYIYLCTIVLIHFGFGVYSIIYSQITFLLLYFVFFYPIIFGTLLPGFFSTKTTHTPYLTKRLFSFGFAVMLTGIAGVLMTFTDTFMLTLFRSLEEVGVYNVVVPTVQILWFIPSVITIIILPMSSEMFEKKQYHLISDGILLLYRYSFFLILPVCLVFIAFPALFLEVLFPGAYLSGAVTLQILSLGTIFYCLSAINSTLFAGIGRPEVNTKITIFAAVINVVGNFLLIPAYGIAGAAWSTTVAMLLQLILSIIAMNKYLVIHIPYVDWIKTVIAGGVLLLFITYGKSLLQLASWQEIGILVVCGGILYCGLLFLFRVLTFGELGILWKRISAK